MHIDWSALGSVLLVAVVATVALVGLFSVGIRALSRREQAIEGGGSDGPATVTMGVSFTLCAALIAFGLYLIIF